MKLIVLGLLLFTGCSAFLLDSSIRGNANRVWEQHLDHATSQLVQKLKNTKDCTSIYEAAHAITQVTGSDKVAYKAVHDLAQEFTTNYHAVPTECSCTGSPHFWHNEQFSHHAECMSQDGNYKAMYLHFFGRGSNSKLGCNTHRSLWHGLVTLTNHHLTHPRTCQWTLLQELSAAYTKHGSDCICTKATPITTTTTTTPKPTTTTTTPKPTTTTTTPVPTTTPPRFTKTGDNFKVVEGVGKACDKFKVVEGVGKGHSVTASGSTQCSDVADNPSDAFVMDACATGQSAGWFKGNNVMSLCQNNASIQPYTAIASFQPDMTSFQTVGHLAAVFIKCEPNGIEIAFQDCGQVPILKHLTSGGFGQLDPNSYYTITV